MKLRMRGNSIRLRLTRDDVRRIAGGEALAEAAHFADGAIFRYSLEGTASTQLRARRTGDDLRVTAPAETLKAWADGDDVALECPVEDGGPDILVEKDFACLSPRHGDEDTFPHPEAGTRRC